MNAFPYVPQPKSGTGGCSGELVTSTEDGPGGLGIGTREVVMTNFPNPFQTTTTVRMHLSQPRAVRLMVFDGEGRVVTTLANRQFAAGEHTVRYDAGQLPSGNYYLQAYTASGLVGTAKLLKVE